MLHITLEIPLRFLLIRGCSQGHNPAAPWIQWFGKALDRAAFSSSIAPLEDHNHPKTSGLHPVLHLHQIGLQSLKLRFVELLLQAFSLASISCSESIQRAFGYVLLCLRHNPTKPALHIWPCSAAHAWDRCFSQSFRADQTVDAMGSCKRIPNRPGASAPELVQLS